MYKNILVPVDVFEIGLADKALSHAQFLAQSSSGKIHLLHVIPAFSPVLTRGFISDARKMEDYLMNTSKEKLVELVKKLTLAENDMQIHIRSGNIRDEVTKLADELKADVVIIARVTRIFRRICWGRRRQGSFAMPMFRFLWCAKDGLRLS